MWPPLPAANDVSPLKRATALVGIIGGVGAGSTVEHAVRRVIEFVELAACPGKKTDERKEADSQINGWRSNRFIRATDQSINRLRGSAIPRSVRNVKTWIGERRNAVPFL